MIPLVVGVVVMALLRLPWPLVLLGIGFIAIWYKFFTDNVKEEEAEFKAILAKLGEEREEEKRQRKRELDEWLAKKFGTEEEEC